MLPLLQTPRIWNVPHNRNPHFVGRTHELNALRQTFGVGGLASLAERAGVAHPPGWAPLGRDQVVALTQTIAGLGGIGKTSLAVEYCFHFQQHYDVVWWLHAEEPATLASDYAALAVKLEPRFATEPNQPALIEWTREWLRQNARWLLVFDNANAPEEIRAYLAAGSNGHILITSRHPAWDDVGATVALPLLPRAESVHLLTTATYDADEKDADALASALGDFPLALEHARAYVRQTSISVAQYLTLFQMRRADLWRDVTQPLNYHSTILTTWDLALQEITAQTPAAADLLNLCAFFAPDDIPLDVIRKGSNRLPELGALLAGNVKRETSTGDVKGETSTREIDELVLNNAIAALRHYSLVERKQENLFVHRLVQAVTRDRLDDAARKQWADAAVRVVDDAFPGDAILTDVESWKTCARLLQHGLAAAEYAEQANVAPEQTAWLLNQMGLYLNGRAQYAAAKELFERALAMCEKTFGVEHEYVAATVNNLSGVMWDLGDLHGAKAYLERALALDEKRFGPDHHNVASDVNNLGTVLQDLGDLRGAKAYLERALAIDEKQFGPDHPNVARDVNNLGMLMKEMGDKDAARQYLERALRILQKVLGDEHPNTRTVKRNLEGLEG
ncbi:MAG: tetratricopeptide repeat protein [Chloroflexi bacterium]|nr:tetratricopeptide repeat protein [Chloroflexota bacterium]